MYETNTHRLDGGRSSFAPPPNLKIGNCISIGARSAQAPADLAANFVAELPVSPAAILAAAIEAARRDRRALVDTLTAATALAEALSERERTANHGQRRTLRGLDALVAEVLVPLRRALL